MNPTKPLMLHIVAGYPNFKESILLGKTLIESGCKYLEVQFPFLDPIADGPVIKNACEVSVKNGMNFENYFQIITELTAFVKEGNFECELICMSYYNPIYRYNESIGNFYEKCISFGVDKFIIPDLPYGEEYVKYEILPVISSMVKIEGFNNRYYKSDLVYCVSGFGVTGETSVIIEDAKSYVSDLKSKTGKKVALGFGIKTKEEVNEVLRFADFAVIGSQILKLYLEKGYPGVIKFLTLDGE